MIRPIAPIRDKNFTFFIFLLLITNNSSEYFSLQHFIAVVIDHLHGDPSGVGPVEGAVSTSSLIAITWIIKQSE
jgi:hypothetical protein